MVRILAVIVLLETTVIIWVMGAGMSSDSIGMAAGVLMGALASVPAAYLAARSAVRDALGGPTYRQGAVKVLPETTSIELRNGTGVQPYKGSK